MQSLGHAQAMQLQNQTGGRRRVALHITVVPQQSKQSHAAAGYDDKKLYNYALLYTQLEDGSGFPWR